MLWLRALAAFGRRPKATTYEPVPLYASAVPVLGSAPSVAAVRATYLPTLQTDVEELHEQLRDAVAEVRSQSMVLAELVASVRAQEFVLQNVLATVQHERAIGVVSEATLDLAALEARLSQLSVSPQAEAAEASPQRELGAGTQQAGAGSKVSLVRPSRVSLVERVSLVKAAGTVPAPKVSLEKALPGPRVSLVKVRATRATRANALTAATAAEGSAALRVSLVKADKADKAQPRVSLVKAGRHAAPVRVSLEKANPLEAPAEAPPEGIWVSMTLPVVTAAQADAMGTLSEISSARPATTPEPVTVDLRKESQVA